MDVFDDEEKNEKDVLSVEDIKQVIKDLEPVFIAIAVAIGDLVEAVRSNSVSYDEAMKYFIAHKDDSPEIAKGAILKKATGDGFEVVQVFLDKNNKLVTGSLGKPLGYKKMAKQLDDELLHLFKGNDLIIVE